MNGRFVRMPLLGSWKSRLSAEPGPSYPAYGVPGNRKGGGTTTVGSGPVGYQEWRVARFTDELFDREPDDDVRVHPFDLSSVNALLVERVHGKQAYGL